MPGISGGGGHVIHTSEAPPTTEPLTTTVAPTTGCKSTLVFFFPLATCFATTTFKRPTLPFMLES